MENIKKILAVSWITQSCQRTVRDAASLATKCDAELSVIHVIDTSWAHNWTFPLKLYEEERRKGIEKAKSELDGVIEPEKKSGLKIKTVVKDGDPVEEILNFIKKEKIDLLVLNATEESRIEQFMIGGNTDAIIRKMPCSIFLVKSDLKKKST